MTIYMRSQLYASIMRSYDLVGAEMRAMLTIETNQGILGEVTYTLRIPNHEVTDPILKIVSRKMTPDDDLKRSSFPGSLISNSIMMDRMYVSMGGTFAEESANTLASVIVEKILNNGYLRSLTYNLNEEGSWVIRIVEPKTKRLDEIIHEITLMARDRYNPVRMPKTILPSGLASTE